MCGAIFDLSIERTPFKIIDTRDIVFTVKPQSVTHQDQMHLLVILHFNCVDTIDARDERGLVRFEMGMDLGQDFSQQIQFFF